MEEQKFSVHKRIKSFSFAFTGIGYFFKTQHNAWIHAVACAVSVILGFVLKISMTEWCLIILCNVMVFTAEMLNTAVELLTDIVSPGFNEMAGKVKDVAAAAVLFTAAGALIIGLIIFIPKVLPLFQ